VLKNNPLSPEEELSDALVEKTRDIAIIEPDQVDWGKWVGYLLEELDTQAGKIRSANQYEYALNGLVEKLQNRIQRGKW